MAQVLMLATGYVALVPPAIASSHYKAWDFVDKRWVAAAYLSSVGLVYLPGLLKRLWEDVHGATDAIDDSWSGAASAPSPTMRAHATRAFLALAAGSVLSLVYVASIAPPALTRPLDSHELVQLGGLQAIATGAVPFLEARTQYGPGQQLLIDDLVRNTEMSVRGARLAHLMLNGAAIAVVFSTMFFAYGWAIGAGIIFLALFISPLQVTTFVGWGLIVRWLGPFLVGALVPPALGSTLSPRARSAVFLVLGAGCGVLAWISQENGSTSVMTVLLVLSAAFITRRLSPGYAVSHAVAFVAGLAAALFGLLLVQFGPSHLRETLTLYQSGSGLVFAGFTNTAWTDANTHWTEPLSGRG
ncbi:MAG: hypothetical protein M3Z05_04150, partial [Gemmatimonadota bacterium]|nr:hypothetical protein [Gemmatimonadota bacterium]